MEDQSDAEICVKDNFFSPQNKSFYDARPKPYKRLNKAKREKRLLLLKAGNRNHDQLEIEIADKVSLIAEQPPYYALSYAAGSHQETEKVSIGGRSFNAFRTLATALRRIRDHLLPNVDEGRYAVWADQICINQSNFTERAHQVEHMREIYEGAQATIIYLGDDRQGSRGMRFLQRIWELIREKSMPDSEDDPIVTRNTAAEWVVEHVKDPQNVEDWMAVCKIYSASWWRRGWVRQEAIVSRNAIFLYGDSQMSFREMALTWDIVVKAHGHITMSAFAGYKEACPDADIDEHIVSIIRGFNGIIRGLNDMNHINLIFVSSRMCENKPFQDMITLLRHSRRCETTDPRDRVYAFIGLADPAYSIKPNYESSIQDVYIDATARIIRKERSLNIIFEANEKERKPDLPSWVPDWSSTSTRDSMLLDKDLLKRFQASQYYSVDAQISFPQETYGRVLQLEVFNLGQLSLEGAFGPANEGTVQEKLISWKDKARFKDFTAPADVYPGGGTVDDAFWEIVGLFHVESDFEHVRGSAPETLAAYKGFDSAQFAVNRVFGEDWSFFVTPRGYMGVTPSNAQYDDYLCIAFGAPVPFVLRNSEGGYKFIGEAYVPGLMDGEAIKMMEAGDLHTQMVNLI